MSTSKDEPKGIDRVRRVWGFSLPYGPMVVGPDEHFQRAVNTMIERINAGNNSTD